MSCPTSLSSLSFISAAALRVNVIATTSSGAVRFNKLSLSVMRIVGPTPDTLAEMRLVCRDASET